VTTTSAHGGTTVTFYKAEAPLPRTVLGNYPWWLRGDRRVNHITFDLSEGNLHYVEGQRHRHSFPTAKDANASPNKLRALIQSRSTRHGDGPGDKTVFPSASAKLQYKRWETI